MITVLVAVQQSTPMLKAGGTTQCWKPLLTRWTVTDRIGALITVHLSWYINLRNVVADTHSLFKVLPFQETGTYIFSWSHAEFQQLFMFFPLSISLARIAFSLVNLQNIFQLIASGMNTRCFYMVTSVGLVLYMLADLGQHGELLTKRMIFLVQPSARLVRIAFMKLPKPIFDRHNFACKPPQNACMHTTLGHFQTVRLRTNSGQTESGYNGRQDHGSSTGRLQLAVVKYIYTYKFSPQI